MEDLAKRYLAARYQQSCELDWLASGITAAVNPPADQQVGGDVRVRFGPCDNAAVFAQLVPPSGVGLLPCIFRTCNMAPFCNDAVKRSEVDINALALAGIISAMRFERNKGNLVKQQLIAECLVPNYSIDKCMQPADAQAEVNRLTADPANFQNERWFVEVITRMPTNNGVVAGVWNLQNHEWMDNVTGDARLEFFASIVAHPACRERDRYLYCVFILLISFATIGLLSHAKQQRIMDKLRPLMPDLVGMYQADDVRLTFINFAEFLHDWDVNVILQRMLTKVPVAATRLRELLSQATGSNVTALDIIVEAIHKHPDFPWIKIRRLYRYQWDAVIKASRRIDSRIYYGFCYELGAPKATHFREFTWVGYELLTAFGNTKYQNYRGIAPDEKHAQLIADMIKVYKESQDEPDRAGEELNLLEEPKGQCASVVPKKAPLP